VRSQIEKQSEKINQKLDISIERVRLELARLAFFDALAFWNENTRHTKTLACEKLHAHFSVAGRLRHQDPNLKSHSFILERDHRHFAFPALPWACRSCHACACCFTRVQHHRFQLLPL
jgi:hypothetical protein